MVVIGLDPGTATTGYGLLEEQADGRTIVLDFGVIKTPQSELFPKRLQILYQQLLEVIHLHQPESGAVEKLFFQKNVRSAMQVGQARGVVLLALANSGVEVAEYAPMEVKIAVAGYGAAEKNQVQNMVKTLLNMNEIPRPDDAADALAIALCHIHSRSFSRLSEAAE